MSSHRATASTGVALGFALLVLATNACGGRSSLELPRGSCAAPSACPPHERWDAAACACMTLIPPPSPCGPDAGGAGLPVTLASAEASPTALAVDATSVYWTDYGTGNSDGAVRKVSICGGATTTLAAGQNWPTGLVVDATNVYWLNRDGLMTVPIGGGAPTQLAFYMVTPMGIAVTAGGVVYWFNDGSLMATGGGATSVVADAKAGNLNGLAVDSANVYWSEWGCGCPTSDGTINRIALEGGGVTTLASGLAHPSAMAIDGTHVYWVTAAGGEVMKVSLGGDGLTTLATGAEGLAGIAVDADSVYWINSGEINAPSSLSKVPIAGGAVTTLAKPSGTLSAIAVDAWSVYWATPSSVVKLAK